MANTTATNLKEQIVAALIDHYQSTLTSAVVAEELMTELAQTDENNGADELTSKREEMMAEVEITDAVLGVNKDRILALSNIDLNSTSDTVKEGSLVITDGETHFLIATATEPIEYEGKSYLGISSEAPIYKELEGKQVGDYISTPLLSFTIKEVL